MSLENDPIHIHKSFYEESERLKKLMNQQSEVEEAKKDSKILFLLMISLGFIAAAFFLMFILNATSPGINQ